MQQARIVIQVSDLKAGRKDPVPFLNPGTIRDKIFLFPTAYKNKASQTPVNFIRLLVASQ